MRLFPFALALRSFFTMKKCLNPSEIPLNRYGNADDFRGINSYEAAIQALNGLQSNAKYLKERYNQKLSHTEEFSKTILQVEKYLLRCGITFEQLNNLSVIHVAGTKGKGSTCAYCESILRHHGYKTGFYSSPHLLEVRERIRINGEPISHAIFSDNFWKIYNKCDENKSDVDDMPLYFRFLTILAFKIFLEEKVDVAIIEVGIGGQYDCTNVLRKVPIVGITSLGLDHTNILGNTIDRIAWHKAGIMKPFAKVFSANQPEEALKVLRDKSNELKCTLEVVPGDLVNVQTKAKHFIPDVLSANASLAIALSHAWVTHQGDKKVSRRDFTNTTATQQGLENFAWAGRYQIIYLENIVYYLDGAHTPESIEICINWFKAGTINSTNCKALIFNTTGDRDSNLLLSILHSFKFDRVIFVPNVSGLNYTADTKVAENQMHRCYENRSIWLELCKKSGRNTNSVLVLPTVLDALDSMNNNKYDLLVTGSLYLMGAVFSIVDPELKRCQRLNQEISIQQM